ncbi:MAG: NAD(P)H:quinone oxidoreductase [Planctomycetota bacterium]
MTKVNVVFYSMYGHIWRMARAVAEGAGEVEGVEVGIFQVPETLSDDVLEKMGAVETRKQFADVPVADMDTLAEADAVIFGTPTRFGNMCAQMKAFIDRTGQLWAKGALAGKVASVFTSSNTQHGGQESTILTFHVTLLHQGMIIVGVPYTEKRQMTVDELSGGSPYGASTIAAPDGSRLPSENELAIAGFQGRRVAEIANRLTG